MESLQKRLEQIGIHLPTILLPNSQVNLERWAVVACDQFTSEPHYWSEVEEFVHNEPSTLNLIFPEVYLEQEGTKERIASIHTAMKSYLEQNLFTSYQNSMFLIKRDSLCNRRRWGLLLALDLEKYDYSAGSHSLIRATEETIVSRIPPRELIREKSQLELPHILILINDPNKMVIEPLISTLEKFEKLYSTPLMKDGGFVEAYHIHSTEDLTQITEAFEKLYGDLTPTDRLLFAMGDGNHSLATAKSWWEKIKPTLTEKEREEHPARFALVEIENIYDEGLEFEPIHRLLFDTSVDQFFQHLKQYASSYETKEVNTIEELETLLHNGDGKQRFGYVNNNKITLVTLKGVTTSITAETVQHVIDDLEKNGSKVDYVHGVEVVMSVGKEKSNIALILPPVFKHTFFDDIRALGTFPRKTFSIGQAQEKRYYLEARKIV